ncbi:MAG: hypothetical protein IPL10_12370 [Bacteroidetes bacterium]|nr:hypothetical protein [Bacteroidota bacterium]
MEGINETTICVLVEDQVTKKIVVNHHTILNSIANTIATLRILCRDDNSSIEEIVSFIDRRKELDQLTGNYKYCTSLKGAYQTFSVDKSRMVNHIREAQKSLNANYKLHPDTFDIEKLIDELKAEIIRDFDLWAKAFAISKMYQKCQEDKTILTFSHRQSGWSNLDTI